MRRGVRRFLQVHYVGELDYLKEHAQLIEQKELACHSLVPARELAKQLPILIFS